MPAVIQRAFTPEGATFATTQWAAREDDLFNGELWKWLDSADGATVFPDWEQADRQAVALRTPGVWVWAAIRAALPCAAEGTEGTEGTEATQGTLPAAGGVALRGVEAARGVSPATMAAGSTKERIAAARHNRRVAHSRVSPTEAYARLEERHLD